MRLGRREILKSALLFGGTSVQVAAAQMAGLPNIGFKADVGPPRSETGVGALMPWADALWAVTYNSHTERTGTGLGLYRIDDSLRAERVHVHNGTHANRLCHTESNQVFIGPYVIDAKGNVHFIEELKFHRLTGTMRHLTDPANRVYMLSMEGLLFEVDVSTRKPVQIGDLIKQFQVSNKPHFKGGWTGQGRVVVANNGLYQWGDNQAGLFEWDGKHWTALSRKGWMECAGRTNFGGVIYCTGWDEASVLFWALVSGKWQRYRLPKASHTFDNGIQTEWTRIREIETERFLMDIHGMFYELQPLPFENAIWGVKPICSHLRLIPDYCSFRGLLALGGNQNTPNNDTNPLGGQPQSGLWFGKTDDLWNWGKPQGWGGPWRKTAVKAGEPSEPFLMTGFDKKVLHLKLHNGSATITIEIDFLGTGEWEKYESVPLGGGGYKFHAFPSGFSAHWVRLKADKDCTATAEFMYT
jgi:hypothetical protein